MKTIEKTYFPFAPSSLNNELKKALRDFKKLKENPNNGWQISFLDLFDYLKNNYYDCAELEEFTSWLSSFLDDNSQKEPELIIEEYLTFI